MDASRTHKVYGHVTEEEFFAGVNEAKKENVFVGENGWVDIGEIIHEMWTAFADGRMAIVPKEGFKRPCVICRKPTENIPEGTSQAAMDFPDPPEFSKPKRARKKKAE